MNNILRKILVLGVLIVFSCSLQAQVQRSKSRIKINNMPESKDSTAIILHTPDISEERVWVTTETSFTVAGEINSEKQNYDVFVNGQPVALNRNFFSKDIEIPYGSSSMRIALRKKDKTIQEYYYNIFAKEELVSLAGNTLRPGKYYALIIGIDEYPGMTSDLDNAVRDASMVYNLLASKYTFEKKDMKFLTNPNRADLIDAFDELASKIKPDDNLLIFYAGHGIWDTNTELGYWLPSDASLSSKAAWFQNSSLVNYLGAIKSKHTLLISDACFSGSIFKTRSIREKIPDNFEEIYKLPSRKAITSGTLSEVLDESVFIEYLLDRLENNPDKFLSSETLFSRIKEPVENNSKNTPRMGVVQGVGDEGGDFIFILRKE